VTHPTSQSFAPRTWHQGAIDGQQYDTGLSARPSRRLSETAEAPCPALNIAIAFPPLRPDPEWFNFPLVARVVDRGWPMLGVSDWGAMEMYGTRVVAMDPFTVASQVFG